MALHAINGLELFSGVGMLGEGLRAGLDYLGLTYRTVCHVEREAHAASVLVARMAEGSLDAAPVWSDVTTFDARAWRGRVDCVVAGFPCQDLSVAGKRAGLDGKRSGLFFEVFRIADDCGAWLVVLENVAGIASATATVVDEAEGELEERAASRVVGEMADRGWNAEWLTLSASDVGASHGRARWFCVAWRGVADTGHDRHGRCAEDVSERNQALGIAASQDRCMGNAGLQHRDIQQRPHGAEHPGTGGELGDTSSIGRKTGSRFVGTEDSMGEARECKLGTRHRCCSMADASGAAVRRDSGAAPCAQSEDGRRRADDDHGTECVCRIVADAGRPRRQVDEQPAAHEQDGRTDGAGTMPINYRTLS